MTTSRLIWLVAVILAGMMFLGGCMLRDAHRQMGQAHDTCVISGTVHGDDRQPGPYIVAVFAATHASPTGSVEPADFFVMEEGGRWVFALEPGLYRVLAFRSLAGNLEHDPGDPVVELDGGRALDCGAGTSVIGISLVVADADQPDLSYSLVLNRQRDGFIGEKARTFLSLGNATAYGQVTTLDHARFAMENATDSLWRPVDFMLSGYAGVYFLQPYDPSRTPVLFVHGINGSPRVFTEMIEHLDHERFQPWVYYYPSAMGLNENSDYLTNIMLELEMRYGIERFHLISHSMGGLVAHGFLIRRQERQSPARVPLFISLSTPWQGHSGAGLAMGSSPVVLPVWRDMAPDSEFLTQLFHPAPGVGQTAGLPAETEMHLLFSYRGGDRLTWGTSDGVITLASLLRPEAQDQAASIYGYDTTHIGILDDPAAIDRVNRILADD